MFSLRDGLDMAIFVFDRNPNIRTQICSKSKIFIYFIYHIRIRSEFTKLVFNLIE